MAPRKRNWFKRYYSPRKEQEGLPNPSCESTKTSNLKHLQNQQDFVWDHEINVRIPSCESLSKEVRNIGNETALKNQKNAWIDGSRRQWQSIPQNAFSHASSLKQFRNPNNMTVARKRNWVNNSSVKQRQNLENPSLRNNQMHDFHRHNPYTSSHSQMNTYTTGPPYKPWWRETLLPLTDASQNMKISSKYPPTIWTNITAEPLSKVRSFGSKPAPEPWFSEAVNFQAAAQPNFTSFSFNSRNTVFKFGYAGHQRNSSVSKSQEQFIPPRRTAIVRPFPLESTAPGFTRTSMNAKKDGTQATRAPRNFSSPTAAKNRNIKETTSNKFVAMPTTPNSNSFLKHTSSGNFTNTEIVELEDEDVKKIDTTCRKENNEDEVVYLFTVDSSKAIVTEVDLISENASVSHQSVTVTTPVKRCQKRKLSNTLSPAKKFNAGEPQPCNSVGNGSSNGSLAKNLVADELQCCVCNTSYHTLATRNDETMCAARCGHTFCVPCVRKGVSECKTCGAKCVAFHKLFR